LANVYEKGHKARTTSISKGKASIRAPRYMHFGTGRRLSSVSEKKVTNLDLSLRRTFCCCRQHVWKSTGSSEHRLRPRIIKGTIALIMLMLVLAFAPSATEENRAAAQETAPGEPTTPGDSAPAPPTVEAQAWALMDAESGLYLEGDNPDERLPMAATILIMTALVVLEEGVDPDEEVTISEEAESYVGTTFSNVGLIEGERLTVRDLLVASLVASGTEAVYALADYVGDGSVEQFVGMMNQEAASIGLQNTNFETPAGLDTPGNYSSARDLATLAREALEYPLFAEIVDTTEATISTQNREIEVFNTNQLLNTYPPATGVRTGSSPQAGENIVASAEDGDESYIAVVLGAEDSDHRFRAAETILEIGFLRYELQPLVRQGEVYEEVPLPYRRAEYVKLAAAEEVTGPVDPNFEEVERKVTTEELPPEAEAGQVLGEVEVFVGGQSVGRSALVAQEGYQEASLWDRTWYSVREIVGKALQAARQALEYIQS
jgi:serine-type D-Ala-D-Ala carboxypeptidase (penicillin-binding protein 5/6)